MGRMPWATYLWPGLPILWRRGAWVSLGLALGSGVLLYFALVGSLVWTDLFPALVRRGAWLAVVMLWVGAAVVARWRDAKNVGDPDVGRPGGSFDVAMEHYLKGNWFETECVLAGLLRQNPRDVDAGLMLATLYRRTGRHDEAACQLDRLQRMDEAAKWTLEISRERQWLAEDRQPPSHDPVESTNGE